MPQLFIKRNSEWANRFRSFDLVLNGNIIAEIKDDQLLTLELPKGSYQLKAKVDWCGSNLLSFELQEGDIKFIEIKGFIYSRYLLSLALSTALLYFIMFFKFKTNSLFLGTLLMFFGGYLIYFISFGRDQYLRLIEK